MKLRITAAAAALPIALAALPVFADDIADKLAACQGVASESERLACYDELASSLEPASAPATAAPAQSAPEAATAPSVAEAAPVAPAVAAEPAPAPAPAPQPLTDDIAKQEIKGTTIDRPEYSAVVTHCQELKHEKRLFFFLENGQIWRQSNAGRLNFRVKDCQFDVTVKKDMFGWVMTIPSENERVRVKRLR